MDVLVDVFYYDYVLSKIIVMYEENKPIDTLVSYLKIATVLSRKFRSEKISPLDKQLYLKEAYVKILQVLRMNTNDNPGALEKVFDCFSALSAEYNPLDTENAFISMKIVILAIYEKKYRNQREKNESCELKAQRYLSELNSTQKDAIKQLTFEYNVEKMIDYLRNILKLDNPVMKKFTNYIKKEIDNGRKITTGNSPGTRVGW